MVSDEGSEPADSIVAFALTTDQTMSLVLEPWGMPYEIKPTQRVEVRIVPPQSPPEVVWHDGTCLSVWCAGFAAIFIDGVDVDNRLPTKADIEYFNSPDYRERWERGKRAHAFVEMMRQEHPEEWERISRIVQARVVAGDMFGEDAKEFFADESLEVRTALKYSGIMPKLDLG